MKNGVLLVSPASPYPAVTNGCARLVLDYLTSVFAADNPAYLRVSPGSWDPVEVYRDHRSEGPVRPEALLGGRFSFVFYVGFRPTPFTRALASAFPSFCLTDRHPHPDVPAGLFRGILTHRADAEREGLLLCGGSYDAATYHPNRQGEALAVCVGRIHPDKGQLELVRGYRERIHGRFGLPLRLVGGVEDRDYYEAVRPYLDGVVVQSTMATTADGWLEPPEIAALLNRARFFVSASPRETFGIALAEALACGTTCVVNGSFTGFDPVELGRHVFGPVTGKAGSILDVLEQALEQDVRRDGSDWVRQYSVELSARRQRDFIRRRMQGRAHESV